MAHEFPTSVFISFKCWPQLNLKGIFRKCSFFSSEEKKNCAQNHVCSMFTVKEPMNRNKKEM